MEDLEVDGKQLCRINFNLQWRT